MTQQLKVLQAAQSSIHTAAKMFTDNGPFIKEMASVKFTQNGLLLLLGKIFNCNRATQENSPGKHRFASELHTERMIEVKIALYLAKLMS